jgi:hypothetical protein
MRSEKRDAPVSAVVRSSSITITERGAPMETSSVARCTK